LGVSFAGHVRTIDSPGGRALSAAEFLLGAFIVIGHNVFHVVPNEVPILFVLGLVLVRWRNGGFAALGFKRPASWGWVLCIALVAAFIRIALGDLLIEPLASRFWPHIVAPAGTSEIAGNWRAALVALLIVWSFAALGEEIAYRGYLTLRAAEAVGQSRMAYWIAVMVVSILFGYGHYYKGPAGILDSAVAGFILGVAFMISGRNLWTPILAHGLIDSFAVLAVWQGWAS
jgi:membrane protease YdiL (CAAX protease family)